MPTGAMDEKPNQAAPIGLALQIEIRCLLPLTLPRALFIGQTVSLNILQAFDFKGGAGEGNRTLVISLEGYCSSDLGGRA